MQEIKNNEIINVAGGDCHCYCIRIGDPRGGLYIYRGKFTNDIACKNVCLSLRISLYECGKAPKKSDLVPGPSGSLAVESSSLSSGIATTSSDFSS